MFEHIAWIVIANLALYYKTLRYKFVSDDFVVSKNPPVFKSSLHKIWLRFIGAAKLLSPTIFFIWNNGKPGVVLTQKDGAKVFPRTEELEHFLALLIHVAICVSIYFAFGANKVAFIAAILYSVNPVNNQGTIWPAGRGYALPILSLTLSMALPILSPVLLFFCAWFTAGFLAPLALIGGTHWYLLALMPIVWALHAKKFGTAVGNKAKMETFAEDKRFHLGKLILGVKTFGFYLFLCLVPFRITFYHNFLQSAAGSGKRKCYTFCRYFWFGLASMAGMIAYAVLVPWSPLHWALLAFSITIAPFCNVVRSNQEIAERFAALPNVFLMYALAQVIVDYPVAVAVFAVYYATRTFYTITMYKDEYFITEVAFIEDPHAWYAWHSRAMKRWDTQSYKEALILWVMARLISPNEFKIIINIATCLRLLKNDKEADAFLQLAQQNIVEGQEKESMQFIEDHKRGKLPILM